MISPENLLNMVCTEASEGTPPPAPARELPVLRYDLELIEREDGSLEWVE